MPRIRNAIFRFSGPSTALGPFRDSLLRSLMEDDSLAEFEEIADDGAPALRFAACDGLPFPAFAGATGAHPDVEISARWEDETGRGHSAAIRAGTVQQVEAGAPDERGFAAYLRMSADGRLALALCVTPAEPGEPRLGCVATAERDGMFMLIGTAQSGAELLATGDELSWGRRWVAGSGGAQWEEGALAEALPIDGAHQERLNDLADRLLREWLWYVEGDALDNAVELERFRLYGFVPAKANVRSQGIKRMSKRSGEGGEFFEYDDLPAEDLWIRQALERCWAGA